MSLTLSGNESATAKLFITLVSLYVDKQALWRKKKERINGLTYYDCLFTCKDIHDIYHICKSVQTISITAKC